MKPLRRQLAIGAAALAAVVATAVALAGTGTPLSARDRNWQQDVAYLARELPLVHVAGLTGTSRPAWDAAAARLESAVPQLSNGQVIVGMARMVAMLHDDETQLTMPPSAVYPFAAQWVGGELHLVAVPGADRELLGARLVAVDGRPVAAVLGRLRQEIDYQDRGLASAVEVDWDMVSPQFPGYLNNADLLDWLGVTRSAATAGFTVQLVTGRQLTIWLTALTASAHFPKIDSIPLPLYLQHRNQPYWMQILTAEHAVYLKYNNCLNNDGFQRLATRALQALREHPGFRLIVDLRDNPGGDSAPFESLIYGILANPAVNRRGRVIGLINGFTDSSASVDAYNLQSQTNALLIGQQVADPIDEYGDSSGVLRLPHYGIDVSYTTAIVNPSLIRFGIPDVVIAPTLHDVLTGYDPVLAAALRY